jgi:molybdopterin/thiamine biosynthesis adenylyltransferase
VAEHPALSGVGHLTGVDLQLFESENVYRHVLGGEAVGMPKVQALAQLLKMRLPEIGFQPEQTDLASWTSDLRALAGIDAVVLATGAPHVERAFIRRLYAERAWQGPLISTWLEPLGLGGHAQRTIPGLPGCLECLHRA